MNCWQRLAIKPTSDLRAIKKAYAVQLKLMDPETDPNAFIALREALQRAQLEAECLAQNPIQMDTANILPMQAMMHPALNNLNQLTEIPQSQSYTASNFDIALEIDNDFQQLKQYIEMQNTQFNLQHKLSKFADLIKQLDKQQSALQIEKINALLNTHALGTLAIWLKIKPQDLFNDLEINQYEFDYIEKSKFTESELYSRSQDISVYLEKKQLSDSVFQLLKELLFDINFVSDEEKQLIKLKLLIPFAASYRDDHKQQFKQFATLWLNNFPISTDPDKIHLYEKKILKCLNRYQTLMALEDPQSQHYESIKKLKLNQSLKCIEIWRFKRHLNDLGLVTHLDSLYELLGINALKHQQNWWKLKTVLNIKLLLWIPIVLSLCIFYFFANNINNVVTATILAFSLGFFYFFALQMPLAIQVLHRFSSEKQQEIAIYFWFTSAIILCILVNFIAATLHQSITFIWVLLTCFLWVILQLRSRHDFFLIFTITENRIERFCTLTAVVLCSVGIIAIYAKLAPSTAPWLLFYALVPISILIAPHKFNPLFSLFKFEGKDLISNYYRRDWLNLRAILVIIASSTILFITVLNLGLAVELKYSLVILILTTISLLLVCLKHQEILAIFRIFSLIITILIVSLLFGFLMSLTKNNISNIPTFNFPLEIE